MPVVPCTSAPAPLSTTEQLQSTLNAVMAVLNSANQNPSSNKQPPPIPSLKLPGGKEIQLGISVKPQQQQKQTLPQATMLVATPTTTPTAPGTTAITTVTNKKQMLPQSGVSIAAPATLMTMPPALGTTIVYTGTQEQKGADDADVLKMGTAFSLSASKQLPTSVKMLSLSPAMPAQKQNVNSGQTTARVTNQKKASQEVQVLMKLEDLETELKGVATKWRKLGRGLGQNDATLEEISATNGNNPEKCLLAVLTKQNKTGKFSSWSWKALCKALSKDTMGEKPLADSLLKKYGSNVKIVGGNVHKETLTLTHAMYMYSCLTMGSSLRLTSRYIY